MKLSGIQDFEQIWSPQRFPHLQKTSCLGRAGEKSFFLFGVVVPFPSKERRGGKFLFFRFLEWDKQTRQDNLWRVSLDDSLHASEERDRLSLSFILRRISVARFTLPPPHRSFFFSCQCFLISEACGRQAHCQSSDWSWSPRRRCLRASSSLTCHTKCVFRQLGRKPCFHIIWGHFVKCQGNFLQQQYGRAWQGGGEILSRPFVIVT